MSNDGLNDRDFKLEILKLTTANASLAGIRNPVELAKQHLDWCLEPLDKPEPPQRAAKAPRAKRT